MTGGAPVLVVGSGPVGLTLTCELVRRGTAVRTIERVAVRERESKGIWIMPRTLEIFDSFGIADHLIAKGQQLVANDIYTRNRRIASVGYGRIGPTRYPFALVIPQWEVEDALNEVLARWGGRVETTTALEGVEQGPDGVTATLRRDGGEVEHARVGWLVGCDGRTSPTRDMLGIGFEGERYETTLLLADAVLDGEVARDRSHTFQGTSGAFIAVPLPGGLTRAVVYGPPTEGRVEPTLDRIHELMHQHGPAELSLRDPRWLSAFRIQRRMADRLRLGRCLLAGDAAHVHSPFGGQGMNTGIQDATNLGWKLAAVAAGTAGEDLLDSYEVERHQVAERVLADTHRQTRAFLDVSGPRAVVRDLAVRTMSAAGVLDRRIGTSLAGYFDSYRTSPLAHRRDRGPTPQPGDHVPDVPLDGPGTTGTVHGLLAPDQLTLLLLADPARTGDDPALATLAKRVEQDGRVAVRTATNGPELAAALGAPHGAALLVRPDGYLVCRTRLRSAEHLLEHAALLAPSPTRLLAAAVPDPGLRDLERTDTR